MAWICVLLCGDASGQTSTYTVKPGDSLSKIARSQGCTVEALAKANDIKLSAVIQAGQTLKLPGKAAATSAGGSHTIQPGDTFSSISRQHGISVESLLAANPGLDPKTLKPGQRLLLAPASRPSAAKPATIKTETPREPAPAQTATALRNSSPPAVEHTSDEKPAVAQTEKPSEPVAAPTEQPSVEKVRTVIVDAEMTFVEFATQNGSNIQRLNELNGLDLTGVTVLAKGSELYVPVQP